MKTDTDKRLWAISVSVVIGLVLIWFSTSTHGVEKTYDVGIYSVPEQRTDAARAIDAYERVMQRLMRLIEKNFGGVNFAVKEANQKLDSIRHELADLSNRLARIESALNIKASPKACSVAKDEKQEEQDEAVPLPETLE
ncbi:MAG: hypothetical protein FVQ80_08440 [Planctomycetes bacterium]|nr:hypothetical protein [Planctomycetota bacterium]